MGAHRLGCAGPALRGERCGLEVVSVGLCQAHYRQQRRGRPLVALRDPLGTEKLPLRVKVTTLRALEREARKLKVTPYRLALSVLEERFR